MKKRLISLLVVAVFIFGIAALRYGGDPDEPPYPPTYVYTPPTPNNL